MQPQSLTFCLWPFERGARFKSWFRLLWVLALFFPSFEKPNSASFPPYVYTCTWVLFCLPIISLMVPLHLASSIFHSSLYKPSWFWKSIVRNAAYQIITSTLCPTAEISLLTLETHILETCLEVLMEGK